MGFWAMEVPCSARTTRDWNSLNWALVEVREKGVEVSGDKNEKEIVDVRFSG